MALLRDVQILYLLLCDHDRAGRSRGPRPGSLSGRLIGAGRCRCWEARRRPPRAKLRLGQLLRRTVPILLALPHRNLCTRGEAQLDQDVFDMSFCGALGTCRFDESTPFVRTTVPSNAELLLGGLVLRKQPGDQALEAQAVQQPLDRADSSGDVRLGARAEST
jgi:hypothetical protein